MKYRNKEVKVITMFDIVCKNLSSEDIQYIKTKLENNDYIETENYIIVFNDDVTSNVKKNDRVFRYTVKTETETTEYIICNVNNEHYSIAEAYADIADNIAMLYDYMNDDEIKAISIEEMK